MVSSVRFFSGETTAIKPIMSHTRLLHLRVDVVMTVNLKLSQRNNTHIDIPDVKEKPQYYVMFFNELSQVPEAGKHTTN